MPWPEQGSAVSRQAPGVEFQGIFKSLRKALKFCILTISIDFDLDFPVFGQIRYEHSSSELLSLPGGEALGEPSGIPLLSQGTLRSSSDNFGYLTQNQEPQQSPSLHNVDGCNIEPSPKRYIVLLFILVQF